MRVFKIPRVNLAEAGLGETEQWTLARIPELDAQLQKCKSRLDAPYKRAAKQWEMATAQMEPSKAIKQMVTATAKPQLVSNAWLKLAEMIAAFELLPRDQASGVSRVRMFDNASSPGSFIMAANWWATTMANPPVELDWVASSLVSAKAKEALGDTYHLARNYPERFAMVGTDFNGDTTDARYLRHLMGDPRIAGSFDLYTSDFGMWVAADEYNYQEAIGARGNLGQVLMGLIVLRPGGSLVTKAFTHMSSFTISLIAIVAGLFEEAYLTKPITSKGDNSEEYWVARGYVGRDKAAGAIDMMLDRLEHWQMNKKSRNFAPPMVAGRLLPREFVDMITRATAVLVAAQCEKIDANLAEFTRMTRDRATKPSAAFVAKHVAPGIDSWFKAVAPKVMARESWLRAASEAEVAAAQRKRAN